MSGWYRFPHDIDVAPRGEGVYILSESASDVGIAYVGRADDLRDRLGQHPDPSNPCLKRKNISFFAYEQTPNSESREQELINRLDPPCNRQ